MKIISIVNQKGGCGKTVVATNLATALSKKSYQVLLIDLDPQGHSTFSLRGKVKFTIADILERISQRQNLPQYEEISISIMDKLHLIPSSLGLASLEYKLSSHPEKLSLLSSFLKNEKGINNFDYIILDCPPNLGILTLNALIASNYSIIPLLACELSIKGIEMLKNIFIMIKEFKGTCPAPFYLINQVDRRTKFCREFIEKTRNQLGNLLLNTIIRTNIHIREAIYHGESIFNYKPKSRGAKDFMDLAEEIEKLTTNLTWASLFLKGKDFEEVYVVGDFNDWRKEENYKLKRIGTDIWGINLPLEKGKYRYKFLTQEKWLTDPHNKLTEDDPFGGKNSLLFVE
jgi:chromosome partitioning protein